jgi:hypothetical protein
MAPQPRTALREPVRDASPVLRRGEVRGRNGEILRREPQDNQNSFDFPDSVKEEGWSYQWCRTDIYGNADGDINEIPLMQRAGWRPVNPSQLDGYFKSENKDRDCIIRSGLMLMERPIQLTQEAQAELKAKADGEFQRGLGHVHDDTFRLPSGFELDRKTTGVQRDVYEQSPSDFKPTYGRVNAPVDD